MSGFQDPFVEAKIRLNDPEAEHRPPGMPAMGLLLQTTLPVGNRQLTADAWQPRAALALEWELTKNLSLASNLGCAWLEDSGERFTQCFASASAGLQLDDECGRLLRGVRLQPGERPRLRHRATSTPASPTWCRRTCSSTSGSAPG